MARENRIVSKQKSREYYDRLINPVEFTIGDRVWFIKEPKLGKLKINEYLGPFEVLKLTDRGSIVINHNGKSKTVHANKLSIAQYT